MSTSEVDTIREFLMLRLRRTLEMREILREVQVKRKMAPLTNSEEEEYKRLWATHQFVPPVGQTRDVFYSKGLARILREGSKSTREGICLGATWA